MCNKVMCLLTGCTEKTKTSPLWYFCPNVHNLNIILSKHHANWGHCTKLPSTFQNYHDLENQREAKKHLQSKGDERDMVTKCNIWSLIGSGTRIFFCYYKVHFIKKKKERKIKIEGVKLQKKK